MLNSIEDENSLLEQERTAHREDSQPASILARSAQRGEPAQSRLALSSTNEIVAELDQEGQLRLEVIQALLEPCDRITYGKRLQEAAEKLGKSKRTVQRLVKKWEEEGLTGLIQTKRSDLGSHRIKDEVEKFILKTYQDGNKGSKRITPKQVFLRTKVKAQELGIKAPSHMTVYRVLKPLIEKKHQVKSIRSTGWRGSQLSVKTRAGQDLSVEYSNHVWQCDHTRADILLVDK